MAPLIPRMQVFEILDFPWFPNFLRAYIQAALTVAWTSRVSTALLTPSIFQTSKPRPASIVATLLRTHLSPYGPLSSYIFIDFCAGGGGPTPSIEQDINARPKTRPAVLDQEPVRFVLTDLHPHPFLWSLAGAWSPRPPQFRRGRALTYVHEPVDATCVSADLLQRILLTDGDDSKKKIFRLFNLAFHHFDDDLARRILKDTVNNSRTNHGGGIGIFELQSRSLAGFAACCLLLPATLLLAPYYALKWGTPLTLLAFTYLVPVVPVVLVWDGWMSCLRTRTVEEVEALLRTCGADGGEEEIARWEVKSGRERFLWPVGSVNWVMLVRREEGEGEGSGRVGGGES
ncbi:hypothetical protein VTJ49DRAFT_7638 [Mycothermus thermophilus]|uniref:Uncharacterized protein n=1 Tax=Humicola insolens TaxID=85995 RepID=A0ABR3VHI8_HUMIN